MANDVATEAIAGSGQQVGTVSYMIGGNSVRHNRQFTDTQKDNQPAASSVEAKYTSLNDDIAYYNN